MSPVWVNLLLIGMVVAVVWNVYGLLRRRQHPLRIFVRTGNIAFYIAIAAIAGILPPVAGWLWGPVLVLVGGAIAYACMKALAPVPAAEGEGAVSEHGPLEEKAPHWADVAFTGVLAALVAYGALFGG